MESDLHPMSYFRNLMFKFADDTNLLVPQFTDISAKAEILNVKSWAFENQMEINWDKTTELVFECNCWLKEKTETCHLVL